MSDEKKSTEKTEVTEETRKERWGSPETESTEYKKVTTKKTEEEEKKDDESITVVE